MVYKIDFETAEKNVTSWLDAKSVEADEREEKQQFIKTLINAVRRGNLVINDTTFEITQTLKFPVVTNIATINELKYKARAACGELHAGTRNINGVNMAVYVAYAVALTSELKANLDRLDSEDFKVLQAITSFFL